MKRLANSILLILLFVNSITAQDITTTDNYKGGYFISTTMLDVYQMEDKTGRVSLGVAYNEALQSFFSLNLELTNEGNNDFREGNVLQLITSEGEIIILHNSCTLTSEQYTNGGKSIIISYGVQYNEKELVNLDKIMNEYITKIKIETDNGIIERNIENNRFSISIYKCFTALKKHLESMK